MRDESKEVAVLFAAGGTGGHLFPAIAIAEEITRLRPNARIAFVGTRDKIEARVVPGKGFAFHTLWISGLQRRAMIGNLLFPVKVVVSLCQSFFLLKKVKPDVVVGTGGYVCGPILFAASLLRIPTVVHESNSYPGVTTRMVASRVSRVFITFGVTKKWLKNVDEGKIVVTGNPTRGSLAGVSRGEASQYFGFDPKITTLFVFGGSLGASSLNLFVETIARDLTDAHMQLIWQTGEKDFERFAAKKDEKCWIGKFIDRMEYGYASADLVMCRAGATTLAELTRLGKPAILVPYPYAAANHQELNAQAMVEAGAAVSLKETELAEKGLATIRTLLGDKARRKRMSEKSLELGKPHAGKEIAEQVLNLAQR